MAYSYGVAGSVSTADERPLLEAFLDHHRRIVVAKVAGVSEEDARRRLVPSDTTLASVVRHLTRVETSWFQYRLAQRPLDELPHLAWVMEDPDARDFLVPDDVTLADLVAAYQQECEASRAMAARYDLDHVVPHPDPELGHVSLRWIYVHMIEEVARHAGHLDILREQIDGATGN